MLLGLGVSHRTAPLELRERLAFTKAEVPEAVRAMRDLPGVEEAVLLSTCNRVECFVACAGPRVVRPALVKFLARLRGVPAAAFERAVYATEDLDMVRHVIEVAAGLDSQVVGEPQILGQVREAHETALRSAATGALLNGVFNRALAAAKRIRHETEIGRLPASVASVAVDLAEKIFGGFAGRTVLLLGTGETSVLVAESLMEGGAPRLLVAGEKHLERARALAARFDGEALALDAARERLAEADIVIVATAAADYLVTREHVARSLKARRARAQFLVDLSVPRNVDPAAAELDQAYLYNLDDLKAVADSNLARRAEWLIPARAIVSDAVGQTGAWLATLAAVPTIAALRAFGEACRQDVLARARALPPEARRELEAATHTLVAKLLHRPISALKDKADGPGAAAVLRRLFGLE